MIRLLRQKLRRITGISTPIGGISWVSPTSLSRVPRFNGTICITYPENGEFIAFLEKYNRKIVFLDAQLDASVGTGDQAKLVEAERLDLSKIASGAFSGMALPLPNNTGRILMISFYFGEGHVLKSSHGGTGITTIGINGFFEVRRTFLSGPSTAYHLVEVYASLEDKIAVLNS